MDEPIKTPEYTQTDALRSLPRVSDSNKALSHQEGARLPTSVSREQACVLLAGTRKINNGHSVGGYPANSLIVPCPIYLLPKLFPSGYSYLQLIA